MRAGGVPRFAAVDLLPFTLHLQGELRRIRTLC